MPAAWVFVVVAGIAVVAFLVANLVHLRRCPRPSVEPWPEGETPPRLSVIIPARNEAEMLEGCLRSALAQDYPDYEVIVVDDASEDETGEIAARLAAADRRCRVVEGRPLPPGWLGKPNALDHGVQYADGEYLLFIDADVRLARRAATAAMLEMRRRSVDFLSLWPYHDLKGPFASLAQSVMVSMALFADVMQRVGGRRYPEALGAWGPFILVRADAYHEVGGHQAVSASVNEDHVLGRNFRLNGKPTAMLDGTSLVSVTMYSRLSQLWRGWSKNLFVNLRSSHMLAIGAALLTLLVTCGPLVSLVVGACLGSVAVMGVAVGLVLMKVGSGALVARHVRSRSMLALSPVGGLVAAALYLNASLNAVLRRRVTWKGRSVPVSPAR